MRPGEFAYAGIAVDELGPAAGSGPLPCGHLPDGFLFFDGMCLLND